MLPPLCTLLLAAGLACSSSPKPSAAPGAAPGAGGDAVPAAAAPAQRPQAANPPAAQGAVAPKLISQGGESEGGESEGGVTALWVEPGPTGNKLVSATWSGTAWGAPETIAEGADIDASWDQPPTLATSADGSRVAAWVETDPAHPGATRVAVGRAPKGGAWTRLGLVHADGVAAEHGFVSAVPDGDAVRVIWLDGRRTPKGGPTELRSARITDRIGPEVLLDERVCDCCATAATSADGVPIVAWRDRSAEEIRDIVVAPVAGDAFDPTPVHSDGWKTTTCPVNGAAVDAQGGLLAVAWYTEAPQPMVQVAFSSDGGHTLGPAWRIDNGHPVGRVGVAVVGDEAVVSWVEGSGAPGDQPGPAMLDLRRIHPDGTMGATSGAAPTGTRKSAGFPALARSGKGVLLAVPNGDANGGLVAWQVPMGALALPGTAVSSSTGNADAGSAGAASTAPASAAPSSAAPASAPPASPARQTSSYMELPQDYAPMGVNGKPVPFSQYKGKPLLLNLWATWCPPCMGELPSLKAIHDEWGPKGINMVGVAVDDETPKIQAVAIARGMDWTLAQDSGDGSWRTFHSDNLPTTFLYDADGHLVYTHVGAVPADDTELRNALSTVLSPH